MWRTGRVFCFGSAGKRAVGRCCNNPRRPLSSSAPSKTVKAEKEKRKRGREEAILSSQHGKPMKWGAKQETVYSVPTAPGQKKDTSLPFPPTYSPTYVESSWYQWWEKEGFFSPEQHETLPHAVDRTFSLCIPPPNVTGSLHLGHALTVAIEDTLVRWRRMQGYRVLWVPGCDHAGIATQTVVERKLLSEKGKRRQDFTREEFLNEVWKWKNEKGEEIYKQLKSLGASLDWRRACFTMDPHFSRAVTEAFVTLCDSGLIYRSEGLVNWSCALESAISDIEVDSKELAGQTMLSVPGYKNKVEFGTILSFAYPVDGHEEVVVSTTRPETMLGDVAVAVHPDDPRYQSVHGKQCRHPFTDRVLPVITDSLVDMKLGTGAVKVTPAHDHTDFLLSQKHSLPRLTVIKGDGTMTPPCGQWLEGVKRFDARQAVVDALVERQLFRGKKSHSTYIIPYSIRVQTHILLIANSCSSSLHRYRSVKTQNCRKWGESVTEIKRKETGLIGNPDVLDTWFSSGLFPFAMLGWPEQTADVQHYYPNSILETGSDLIFFWVARMVMLGKELTGQLPFKQVLFHSMVRDKHGRKMSKSLGNVIDPLDVINGVSLERLQEKVMEGNLDPREQMVALKAQSKDFPQGIPQCGTDALRFSFALFCVPQEYVKSVQPRQQNRNCSEVGSDIKPSDANTVLYHCVSVCLALLSPFMPFVTEELFQRLQPFKHGSVSQDSLCLQPYPCSSQLNHWHFPEEEKAFLLIQEVVRTARLLRAQCGLTKDKPAMWAACSPSQARILTRYGSAVWTLGRMSNLHIYCPTGADATCSAPPPEGSLIGVVDHTCQLHLQKGLNADKQIRQLSQRRDKLVPKLKEILDSLQSPDYLTKVPAHVRHRMDNKRAALQQELNTIECQLKALQEE
uniref:Valine--tRNA ligase n=1 Tax=Cynoglossus semilaevis TaxID=244447 RepID=A0A3P8WCY9_CYNSE